MNRREFTAAAGATLGVAALGLPGLALAQFKPEEGRQYHTLDKRAPSDGPAGKIEVIEFFWYSCPHCNAFEPRLSAWTKKLPADVYFHRVPVAFRDDFVPQQRLYYTLETLGKVDELHAKVFDEIHNKRQPTNREEQILAFAEKNGLDRAKFQEIYNSFSVQAKARRARQLQDQYEVQGVPSMGVAGRYITDGDMAGNMDRCLQVVEYLVAEARKAK
ncbi:MAG TPA: thiol:disulfide interchange protein DsbA/DsbL [Ramlibacter sp.]|uniref:thiol:disulfide interchange protein DsbA/DsbL n=1 Tax=Ramlibacter sp. TaxID=1917967 RepID=UPI002D7E62E4|nr:thiol:disulfide interchange protein DsbA/DsbL [Ramlibacter sp.]HET8748229.1 thiol:disulfide interchange protein DsbA/DsbL [Ramlibacter sp.]